MPIEEDISKLYETYLTHTSGACPSHGNVTAFRKTIAKAFLASGFGYKEQYSPPWALFLGRLGIHSRFIRERVGSSISWLDGSSRGRLLDVGCGNGEFLARMRELGWDVVGVEPDPKAAQVGRDEYGLIIFPGVLEQTDLSPESFDAATMVHVIEHLSDPVGTLKAAKNVLKRGGRIVIHTPNISSLGHRWFRYNWRGLEPPRHFFLFSPRALCKIVEMAGFRVLNLKTTFVDYIWRASWAYKKGVNPDVSDSYAELGGYLFLVAEHLCAGWPFRRSWGEQLTLIAIKP
jgi:SAM-dependent methyltransferase